MSGDSDRPSDGGPNGTGPARDTVGDGGVGKKESGSGSAAVGAPGGGKVPGARAGDEKVADGSAGESKAPDDKVGDDKLGDDKSSAKPAKKRARKTTRKISSRSVRGKSKKAAAKTDETTPDQAWEDSSGQKDAAAAATPSPAATASGGPRLTVTPTEQGKAPAADGSVETDSRVDTKPAAPVRTGSTADLRTAARAKAVGKAKSAKPQDKTPDGGIQTAKAAESKVAEAKGVGRKSEGPEADTRDGALAREDALPEDGTGKADEAEVSVGADQKDDGDAAEEQNGKAPKVEKSDRISQPITMIETERRRRSRAPILLLLILLLVVAGGYLGWQQGYLDLSPLLPEPTRTAGDDAAPDVPAEPETPPQPAQPAEAPQEASATTLSLDERQNLEEMLAAIPLETGPVDGVIDEQTRDAIREFQEMLGLPVDGIPTPAFLEELTAVAEPLRDE